MIIEPRRLYVYWYWVQKISTYLYLLEGSSGEKPRLDPTNEAEKAKRSFTIEENAPAVWKQLKSGSGRKSRHDFCFWLFVFTPRLIRILSKLSCDRSRTWKKSLSFLARGGDVKKICSIEFFTLHNSSSRNAINFFFFFALHSDG